MACSNQTAFTKTGWIWHVVCQGIVCLPREVPFPVSFMTSCTSNSYLEILLSPICKFNYLISTFKCLNGISDLNLGIVPALSPQIWSLSSVFSKRHCHSDSYTRQKIEESSLMPVSHFLIL